MNTVERIKRVAVVRGVPISRLETDLGFGNGYIASLKKGTLPAERLAQIAEYFRVSSDYLLGAKDKFGLSFDDWQEIGAAFSNLDCNIEQVTPFVAMEKNRLKWFLGGACPITVEELTRIAEYLRSPLEKIVPKYANQLLTFNEKDNAIKAAFFNGFGDELTQEQKADLWKDAQDFARFKAEQLKKETM